jgi:hypothetical protein
MAKHPHFCSTCYTSGGCKLPGYGRGWWGCTDPKCVQPSNYRCPKHRATPPEDHQP